MTKIEIEIREIEGGFIVEDSYWNTEVFVKDFSKARAEAIKALNKFKKEAL